jgi:hypothetical protein
MEIQYEIRADDYLAFNRHYLRKRLRTPAFRWLVRLLLVLLGIAAVLAGFLSLVTGGFGWIREFSTPWSDPVLGVLLVVLATLVFLLGLVFLVRRSVIRRRLRDDRTLLGPKTLTVSPEGLRVRTPKTNTELLWPVITAVDETADSFYLFVSPFAAVIVPKRAFGSEAEVAEFREAVRRGREDSHEDSHCRYSIR